MGGLIPGVFGGVFGVDDSLFVKHSLGDRWVGGGIGIQICIAGSCKSGLEDIRWNARECVQGFFRSIHKLNRLCWNRCEHY